MHRSINDFVAGDTGSVVQLNFRNRQSKAIIDLTGKTAKIRFKIDTDAFTEKTMTITSATKGLATYQFAAGELKAGTLTVVGVIIDGSGSVITQLDPLTYTVRALLT